MTKQVLVVLALLGWTAGAEGGEGRGTVLWEETVTEVPTATTGGDLWISPADLSRATGFVLKPEGVCRDELCVPIPRAQEAEFLARRSGRISFNLTAFARLLKRPAARDEALSVWYFGPRADGPWPSSLQAPNFTLPDMAGVKHSLSDFLGKKVLLVTWASW